MNYSVKQFESDLSKIGPRPFDTYLLAPFILWFALKSKGAMSRWPRRMLFTAGIYMLYRNYAEYKKAAAELSAALASAQTQTEQPLSEGVDNA